MAQTRTSNSRYGTLLDAVRGVRWPARGAVRSAVPGTHASRVAGTSAEVTEYRLYRQGDDPRRLDWKLLARTDRAFVRIATTTATLPTTFVVDASPSMAFPDVEPTKWGCARSLAVALAAIAHRQGDPVGLGVAADAVVQLPPRTRRGVVNEVAATLDAASPGGTGAGVADLVRQTRGRGRVVVIGDFLDGAPEVVRAAAHHVAAGGELHAVHVAADVELDPPPSGLAIDPEHPDVRRPLGAAARAEYLAAFAAWREGLARDLRAAGAGYTLVATGERLPHAVRRVVAPVEHGRGPRS